MNTRSLFSDVIVFLFLRAIFDFRRALSFRYRPYAKLPDPDFSRSKSAAAEQ